ncbi:hypothetical protein B5X24_HaOG200725 [Helicoverpa armigera]|uniref:Gustatory receptor n=1 Tax=Helicoverpa armigera TaxID=29058 RepID=A0A2W1BTV0_HELAM|nr:hypothetical protein B5X24_HaOG200725 [Helicoverpa armigera]
MEPKGRIKRIFRRYIDKDIQKMILPLQMMQTICLNPKFSLKNNFIKPNNIANNLLAVVGVIFFVSLLIYRICDMMLDENLRRYQTVNFLYFATCVDSFFYGCGFIMNFILHFVHTMNNVNIILIFQEIHRHINDKASSNMAVFRNYVIVSMVFAFQTAASIYVYIVYMHPPWYVVCYVLVLISLDSNIAYSVCFMKLIADKLVLWNAKLLWSLQHGSHVMRCKKMARAYVQILNCFDVYKNIFELPVSIR